MNFDDKSKISNKKAILTIHKTQASHNNGTTNVRKMKDQ